MEDSLHNLFFYQPINYKTMDKKIIILTMPLAVTEREMQSFANSLNVIEVNTTWERPVNKMNYELTLEVPMVFSSPEELVRIGMIIGQSIAVR